MINGVLYIVMQWLSERITDKYWNFAWDVYASQCMYTSLGHITSQTCNNESGFSDLSVNIGSA